MACVRLNPDDEMELAKIPGALENQQGICYDL